MTSDITTRTRDIWDRMAPRYDRAMRSLEPLLFGRDSRPWVCAKATGDTLEVAIGTGLNLPQYPPGIQLTGVDLSPAMLAIAAERAATLGITVDLAEADAEHLPYDDATFDTVVCTLSLCSIPDHIAAIAEMRRVLRPGGRLLLLDHIAADSRLLLALQRLWEKLTLRFAGDHQTRRPLPIVEQAGFTIHQTRRTRAGTVERIHATRALSP